MLKRLFNRFFSQPKQIDYPILYRGKIEIFVRHCIRSKISEKKERIRGFSKEACYLNLLSTCNSQEANITFFLDTSGGSLQDHFLKDEKIHKVVEIKAGTEGDSFVQMLDYVSQLNLDKQTIVYFLEDDYLHKPNWVNILKEAFEIEGVEYATLYDHRDKYFFPEYRNLKSKIFVTRSSHFRTIPSTTQTFGVRFKTLLADLNVHRRYSQGRAISADHEKFCMLRRRGEILVSALPGFSTHAEPDYASPLTDWEKFLCTNELKRSI